MHWTCGPAGDGQDCGIERLLYDILTTSIFCIGKLRSLLEPRGQRFQRGKEGVIILLLYGRQGVSWPRGKELEGRNAVKNPSGSSLHRTYSSTANPAVCRKSQLVVLASTVFAVCKPAIRGLNTCNVTCCPQKGGHFDGGASY